MLAWGLKGTSRVIGLRCNCRRVKQSFPFPFSLYFIKYQDRMYVNHLITSLKCYDVNLHYLIKFGAMFSLRVVVSAWEGFVLHFGCACTCLFVYRIRGGFRFEGASGDVQCRLLLEVVLAVQIRLVEADPHWCWELLGTTSLVAFSNAWHFFLVGKIWSAYFWCLVWDVWFSAQVWQTVTIFFPTLNVFLCLYDTLHTKRELHSWCSMFVVPIFQYFGKCWLYGKAEVTAMTRKIPKANILVHFCL